MKTQLSRPAREPARYTKEYKQEALELWRASGRSAAKVATELGIRPPLLYRWARSAACARGAQGWPQTEAERGRTGGGDPAFARGERQAAGAA